MKQIFQVFFTSEILSYVHVHVHFILIISLDVDFLKQTSILIAAETVLNH